MASFAPDLADEREGPVGLGVGLVIGAAWGALLGFFAHT